MQSLDNLGSILVKLQLIRGCLKLAHHNYVIRSNTNQELYLESQDGWPCIPAKAKNYTDPLYPLGPAAAYCGAIVFPRSLLPLLTRSTHLSLRIVICCVSQQNSHALYPLGPVATLRFCHLRPRCVSKQRRTISTKRDLIWLRLWCGAVLRRT